MFGLELCICIVDMDFSYGLFFGVVVVDVYYCFLLDCMLGD